MVLPSSRALASGAALVVCLLAGCRSSGQRGPYAGAFRMGERVSVGPLTYTVLDAEWLDRLGEGPQARLPQRRFLAVRLSVLNSGAATTSVPTMSLEPAGGGEQLQELTDAAALPDWLGSLRLIKPNETQHGRVLFDVPGAAYRLHVLAESDSDEDDYALVEIPYQVPPETPRPEPVPRAR